MKIKSIILFLSCVFLFSGCIKDDPVEKKPSRTLLVYVIATDLHSYINANVEDMVATATKQNLNGGNLIVFYSRSKEQAELFELKEGPGGTPTRHHIKDYENLSAIDPANMRAVINEVVSLYPADSYGLLYSSHGTAWMPSNFASMTRWFGKEGDEYIEINDLAKGIPGGLFEFIMFDACSMGSIECVYELKDKADRILASPSETSAYGFPYKKILPYFFTDDKADLGKVAQTFYEHYNSQGNSAFANVSVTHTKELDALATITREIFSDITDETMYQLPLGELQTLSYFSGAPTKLYDFAHVISKLTTSGKYDQFLACLNKAVTDTYSTDKLYCTKGGYYDVEHFSGLSFYPFKEGLNELNDWYKKNLSWYKKIK